MAKRLLAMAPRRRVGLLALLTLASAVVLAPKLGAAANQPQQAPSSYQLISQALAAGRINQETAYKYRIFAAFRDTRLPSALRGDDSQYGEAPRSVMEVAQAMPTLSAQTQAELAPFFLPPGAPGSWADLPTAGGDDDSQPESDDATVGPSAGSGAGASAATARQSPRWVTFPAAGGKVKVWAQPRHGGDSAKAAAIARAVTAPIWTRLVNLFWEPLPDTLAVYDGGGPELDIYLIRPRFTDEDSAFNRRRFGTLAAWQGLAVPTGWRCKETAYYLLINSDMALGSATSPGLLQVVAHEITHAITGRMPLQKDCDDYHWMAESTSTWAEHWVYPRAQSEQIRAGLFFANSRQPLDQSTTAKDEIDSDAYAAYVFPFYLSTMRREQAIPAIWANFRNHDLRGGINAGLKSTGKGLSETFPEFAVRNLNRANVDEYTQRDSLLNSFRTSPDSYHVTLPNASVYEKQIMMGMHWLSTEYAYFKFAPTVRTVTFDNSLVPIPWAGVWGLVKIKGQWQPPEDWTAKAAMTWCRDDRNEDIEELVISFTNNEWQDTTKTVDPGRDRPTLRAYPTGCVGWIGTSMLTNTITSTDPNITIVETVQTSMRFALDSALFVPGEPHQYWKTVGGSISWQARVTGDCTGSGQGSVSIPNSQDDHVADLNIWPEGGRMHHSGGNGPWPGDIPTYTVTCSNGQSTTMILYAAVGFFVTDGDKDELAPDGKSFGGDFQNQPAPGIKVHHRYSFRCAAGC